MEPLTATLAPSIYTLPSITFSASIPLLPRIRPPPLSPSASFRHRSRVLRFSNPLPKATSSEEASSILPNRFFGDDRDVVATLEEVPTVEKNVINGNLSPEEPKPESVSDEESQISEFLEKLNIKLENENASPIIFYGSGALVAVWLASALVGAVDSIPLFPKLLEVVGLGYTLWFSSRYLIFKKSREELSTKVESFKQQILGSDET